MSINLDHISLEAAISVCRNHGIAFQAKLARHQRRAHRKWRSEFLTELREDRRVKNTMDLIGVSYSLVYRERKKDPGFDRAVKMAIGKEPFSEEAWHGILDGIHEREQEAELPRAANNN